MRQTFICFATSFILVAMFGSSTLWGQAPQLLKRSPDGSRPGLNYWLAMPVETPADAEHGADDQKLPLLLFLHGGGEGGDDPVQVKKHGPPKMIEQGHRFSMIVVSPQNPSLRQHWDDHQLIELVDHLSETLPVDTNRIYVTGMSRGCFGGWMLLTQNPDRFAAFVGVCGGGLAPYAKRVAHVPVRLFHGADDDVIPPGESVRMADAHRAAGGDCELTIYPNTNHNAWDQTYSDDAMYRWLLDQRRQPIQ